MQTRLHMTFTARHKLGSLVRSSYLAPALELKDAAVAAAATATLSQAAVERDTKHNPEH